MAIDENKLIGSYLQGISSNKLKFATKGQEGSDSNSTPIKTNPSSIRIVSDVYDDKKFTYTRSTVDLNQGAHKIDWSWIPWHNTPGNVTGTFSPYITGTGSSSSNKISINGETKQILVSDALKYNATTDNKQNIVEPGLFVYMDFPANSDNNEDGATDVQLFDRIGLAAYNTPNPNVVIEATSSDTNIARIKDKNGNLDNDLTLYDNEFTGAYCIEVLPNVPSSTLGNVSGIVTVGTDSTSPADSSGVRSTTDLYCNNQGKGFVITKPDNSKSHTDDREVSIKFKCTEMTDNVNGLAPSAFDKEFKIYQSGGDVTLQDPVVSYTWTTDNPEYGDLTADVLDKSKMTFHWTANEGRKGTISNAEGTKITWKSKPTNPVDNTGSRQELDIANVVYTMQTNAPRRELKVTCNVSCNNSTGGITGSLQGTKTSTGVQNSISIYQYGKSWPDPRATLRISVTPKASNPNYITGTTTVPFCGLSSTQETNDLYIIPNFINYKIGPGTENDHIYLIFNNMRPYPQNSSVNGNLVLDKTSFSSPLYLDESNTITADGSNLNFIANDIPAMPSCSWDLTINKVYNDANVDGTCEIDTTPITITVPGNDVIKGGSSPAKFTISCDDNRFTYTSSFVITSTNRRSQIYIDGPDNSCSGSYAKIQDIGVLLIDNDTAYVRGNIYTDRNDTSDIDAQLTIKPDYSNISSISVFNNPIYVRTRGQFLGGDIVLRGTGVSFISQNITTLDYETNTDLPVLFKVKRNRGSINYTPQIPDSITLPNTAGAKIVASTNSPLLGLPLAQTLKMSGTISGSSIDSLNGTAVELEKTSISIPGAALDPNDYYLWEYTPSTLVSTIFDTSVSIKLGTANSRSCTLNYTSNNNVITGMVSAKSEWEVEDNTKFSTSKFQQGTTIYTVKAQYNGRQAANNNLGTLVLYYTYNNTVSNKCTVNQAGADGGYTSITRTFTISCVNAYCTLTSNTITSSGPLAASNSISSIGTQVDYTNASLSIPVFKEIRATGTLAQIGAYDDPMKFTIGASLVNVLSISMPSSITITNTETSTSRTSTYNGTLTDGNQYTSGDSRVSITGNWQMSNGIRWSRMLNTNITTEITTVPTSPGTLIYRLSSATVTVTPKSGMSFSKTVQLNYSWKVIVDGVTISESISISLNWTTKTITAFDEQSYTVTATATHKVTGVSNGITKDLTSNYSAPTVTYVDPNTGKTVTGTSCTLVAVQGSDANNIGTVSVTFTATGSYDTTKTATATATLNCYGKSYYNA